MGAQGKIMKGKQNVCIIFFLVTGILIIGFSLSSHGAVGDEVKVYKGDIREAADFIVRFPTREEAQETFDRLNGIVKNFQSVLAGKSPIHLDDIREKCRFVLETYRKTTVMEWCLLGLCLDGAISLLPGEG